MSVPDVTPLTAPLRALADETRLQIVALLSHGELCVCHLEDALGLPQPTVSRHLAVLRHAGLVATRRDGSWVHYALAEVADPSVARLLAGLVEELGSKTSPEAVARIRAAKGPDACR